MLLLLISKSLKNPNSLIKLGKYFRNSIVNSIIKALDYLLLIIVICAFFYDFMLIISSIMNHLIEFFNIDSLDFIHNMVDGTTSTNTNNTTNTNTTIIHDDGSWSNTIRSLFIYGTGVYRIHLVRGGNPGQRVFIIASTIIGDAATKVVNNTINDPSYVRNHYVNWRAMWHNQTKGEAVVVVDAETQSKLVNVTSNNYISGSDSYSDFINTYLNDIFNQLKFILEPVAVNYSNEVLANQIYDLSIVLFILSLIIVILIFFLLLNIILYINMDRIIKIFNNKFIKWYLWINKKFLSIEIFILGITILYFMFSLITGIRFIATHPIIIN